MGAYPENRTVPIDLLAVPAVGLDMGYHTGPLHHRLPYRHLLIPRDQKYITQLYPGALLLGEPLHVDYVAGLDPVLLSTGAKDSVLHT